MKTATIHTCLWFKENAREAADFYSSVFPDFEILNENPLLVNFKLLNFTIMALNGRPDFDFNESFSLVITCESQEEIDHYWSALSEGGSESMCGWLKDRFGVSWQVVPSILADLMSDHAKAQKVTPVLLQMRKLVIKDLIEA